MKFNRLVRPLLLTLLVMGLVSASFAGVFISVTVAPPPLPVYVQPPCPAPGYIWTPGYWAWDDDGYYWVPGTWVPAPAPGLLWTPGYWGWNDGFYVWNAGYWGPTVGYYGGINYGFGFFGLGFVGGEWHGRDFYYNRAVVNVNNTTITNVYVNKTVIVNNNYTRENHVSFNGPGGIQRQPTQFEQAATRERHVAPTQMQTEHVAMARRDPQLLARNNRGLPPVAATVKPTDFGRRSVVPSRAAGGTINPNALRATPRTMPAPVRNPALANRPTAPGANTFGGANRPAPDTFGNRGAATPGNVNRGFPQADRNVPRPPSAANPAARPYGGNPSVNPNQRPFGGSPSTAERTMPSTPNRGYTPPNRNFNAPSSDRGYAPPRQTEARPAPSRPENFGQPRPEFRQAPPRPNFAERPSPPQMRSAPAPRPAPPQMRTPPPQQHSAPAPRPQQQREPAKNERPQR